MSQEPLWKTVLCWGAVVTFLTLPAIVFTMNVVSIEYPSFLHTNQHINDFKFIGTFFQSLTALVFGLSGLNALSPMMSRFNGKAQPEPQRPVSRRSDLP